MQETLLRELQRQNAALMDSLTAQDIRQRGDFTNQMIRIERNLVQIQELTGQSQQALAEFRQSLQAREEAAARAISGDVMISGDADELFQSAEGALQRGSLATARVAFEEFVSAFPDHEQAPAARLYLGNILSAEGEVQRALEEYSTILRLHPNAVEAPTALYHAALVERDRGNRNAAETMLNQLTAAYPSSPEAAAARDELRRLR